jgi:hypothetical protein
MRPSPTSKQPPSPTQRALLVSMHDAHRPAPKTAIHAQHEILIFLYFKSAAKDYLERYSHQSQTAMAQSTGYDTLLTSITVLPLWGGWYEPIFRP